MSPPCKMGMSSKLMVRAPYGPICGGRVVAIYARLLQTNVMHGPWWRMEGCGCKAIDHPIIRTDNQVAHGHGWGRGDESTGLVCPEDSARSRIQSIDTLVTGT